MKKGRENSFDGPFKVLEQFDKYFIIEIFRGSSEISIDRQKPAYTFDLVNNHKNINDSFLLSIQKSTSTSAANVTKDSRRRPNERNYTLQILPTKHASTHSISIDKILFFCDVITQLTCKPFKATILPTSAFDKDTKFSLF